MGAFAVNAPKNGPMIFIYTTARIFFLVVGRKFLTDLEFGSPLARYSPWYNVFYNISGWSFFVVNALKKWPADFDIYNNSASSPVSRRPEIPRGAGIRRVFFAVPALVQRVWGYFRRVVLAVNALKNSPVKLRRFGIRTVVLAGSAIKNSQEIPIYTIIWLVSLQVEEPIFPDGAKFGWPFSR